MNHFYFGVNPYLWLLIACILFAISVYLVLKKVMNNKVNPQGWLLISVAIFLGAMYSQYAFYDLGRNISKSDAKKIQVAYQESLLSPAGYDFRDALSNLLDDKGIIVPAELSYIGTDIYSNSFTKEDWNKLAKIHKKTNKYM